MSSSLAFTSVQELVARLDQGELTSVALVNFLLKRIQTLEPRLQSFVEVYADEARQAAKAADLARKAGAVLGPLHGIPVALKDLVEIQGRRTGAGSEALAMRRSTVTASLVHRLWQQGAIVLGKTHTVEFAAGGWGTNMHLGTPYNPWDMVRARTPGGSSSGSGVAVAAGLAPLALGTDTGGSIRLPSSWCNLTGLKVSSGRISAHGIMPFSPTLDTPGPMARSVADVRLFYEALRGHDPLDAHSHQVPPQGPALRPRESLAGMRLARMPESERSVATPEVLAAYDAALHVLADAGADIVDIELPYGFAEVAGLNAQIMLSEGYSLYRELVDDPQAPLDEDIRARLLHARSLSAADYLQALRLRATMQARFCTVFEQVDALLTPTTMTPPLPLEEVDQTTAPAHFTRMGNFFNLAALALPCGATASGLPLSLQIVGRPYAEDTVLEIGAHYQQRSQWHLRHPDLG